VTNRPSIGSAVLSLAAVAILGCSFKFGVTALLASNQTPQQGRDVSAFAECAAVHPWGPGKDALAAFDATLRVALEKRDFAALSLLIEFPLRVNYKSGPIAILNPTALQSRFGQVFTPNVRKTVLEQKPKDLMCLPMGGVGYGRGDLWIDVVNKAPNARYAIQSVSPDPIEGKDDISEGVVFVCNAAQHKIAVDYTRTTGFRYRSWNIPRLVTDQPDLTLLKGDAKIEGTGPCASHIRTFRQGDTEYSVGELGCTDGSEGPDARGRLTVTRGDRVLLDGFCYR
jgi:hypothetical protein